MLRTKGWIGAVLLMMSGCGLWTEPQTLADGAEPEIGVPYAMQLYTHCGLRHVPFDGDTWEIHGDLGDGANPPDDFGNPLDNGTVTLISEDEAIYRSEHGAERRLTRGGGLDRVANCL